ncbi:MAG TPA: DUF4157 domain-containing protein [Longimicrobium sp.]|nr:DUF4157 domain-containing protein [Longimicrobium sp.]
MKVPALAAPVRGSVTPHAPVIRRACACGGTPGPTGECEECRRKRLQRSARAAGPAVAPPIVHDVLASPGRPLDPAVRAEMEPRFRHSFADVRVHADGQAAESARAVGAHAYAVGRSVVFAAGRYAPRSVEGRRLIAHELAHVVQQSGAAAALQPALEIGASDDPAEREADRAADAAMAQGDARVAPGAAARVARRDDEPPIAGPPSGPQGEPAAQAPGAGNANSTPAGSGPAPTCPIVDKGTVNRVSWGETAGLYPTASGSGLFDPTQWDQAKLCELLRARRGVAEVGTRNKAVHKASPSAGKIDQMLKKYHFDENFPALDAEVADAEVKWFYISSSGTGPAAHPGATGSVLVKSYGSFYNTGGGDVKKGAAWIHFYKLAPKPGKKSAQPAPEPYVPRPSRIRGDNPSDQVPP